MSIDADNLESARKRLAWRASRRGIREMDLLVGGFAEAHLESMSFHDLTQFEALLAIPDQQLLAWVTRQEPVPTDLVSPMLTQLLTFHPKS
jgi:antitoxin CptB